MTIAHGDRRDGKPMAVGAIACSVLVVAVWVGFLSLAAYVSSSEELDPQGLLMPLLLTILAGVGLSIAAAVLAIAGTRRRLTRSLRVSTVVVVSAIIAIQFLYVASMFIPGYFVSE